jgi:hypothetical protein
MVAMQGTRLPERVLIVKNQRFGRASFVLLSLLCLALIYLCASLLFEINRANYKLQLDARQPIEVYIERRYSAADRQHPILGRHMTAISDLMLLTRALDENRDNLVQQLALPRFEQNVLSYYSNKAIWDLAMRAYTQTQDVAAMQALITLLLLCNQRWQRPINGIWKRRSLYHGAKPISLRPRQQSGLASPVRRHIYPS